MGWRSCSQTQIDWAWEGIEGARLPYLVGSAGYFYDKHRAENDCLASSFNPKNGASANETAIFRRVRKKYLLLQ